MNHYKKDLGSSSIFFSKGPFQCTRFFPVSVRELKAPLDFPGLWGLGNRQSDFPGKHRAVPKEPKLRKLAGFVGIGVVPSTGLMWNP